MVALSKPDPSISPSSTSDGAVLPRRRVLSASRTIAVLIDHIDLVSGGYESRLRQAFGRASRKLGYDVLVVPGGTLTPGQKGCAEHVFELFGAESVAGVILISAGLARFCGPEAFASWCRTTDGLPRCSIGFAVPGVPSVVADNRAGMRDLLEHVVGEHGRRRVAFLRGTIGNVDAEVRHAVYLETLEQYGIEYDPALVLPGLFTIASGAALAKDLLGRGTSFDAVVASNDGMALGALEVLSRSSIAVPRDALVTGFDDVAFGRLANPPLTTVQQPLGRMAALAVELLIDQIEGREVPLLSVLPSALVARESCGCGSDAARPSRRRPDAQAELDQRGWERLVESLIRSAPVPDRYAGLTALRLIEAVRTELAGVPGAFDAATQSALDGPDADDAHEELAAMLRVLSTELPAAGGRSLEALWESAGERVKRAAARAQARQRVQIELSYQQLRETGERLSLLLDRESLRDVIASELSAMRLRHAFILLYADETLRELEPFVSLQDGSLRPASIERFSARLLLPPGVDLACEPSVWLVLPLSADHELLGLAIFDSSGDAALYETLRGQISAALKTCALHAQIVEKTALHERSVRERLATSERMRSLSLLAGGVAHDLNNALGPLIGLSEIVAHQIGQLGKAHGVDVFEMNADLNTIRGAALRATQTIRDLLTLSRQGKIKKEPVDLNQIVAACANDWSRHHAAKNESVELIPIPALDPLMVLGSESHLSRALANLISNAGEAIQGPGRIVVRAVKTRVPQPIAGFEQIEPGEYALLSVSDTGSGIPDGELPRIFEPFYSTKRLGNVNGSGLGLAIVHGVVKEHAGYVNVESRPRAGTVFSIYLPSIAERRTHEETGAAERYGQGRILIVDDEVVQLRTARRILGYLGYDVTTCRSGLEACEIFTRAAEQAAPNERSENPFRLVILDMVLNEDRDGLAVLEVIREIFPSQPALIVSGHAPDQRGRQAAERGIPWLSKPYTMQALATAVDEILAKSPALAVLA